VSKALLRIGPDLALPALEAQTQTLVVYGGKGMGKTNFAAVLAEELAANHLRFSWIDPVGVAWGLKHSADGRGPGVEVLILGGAHGDIPINPAAGAIVADLVEADGYRYLVACASAIRRELERRSIASSVL
jgi:DNA helicase HerA-like ATPase